MPLFPAEEEEDEDITIILLTEFLTHRKVDIWGLAFFSYVKKYIYVYIICSFLLKRFGKKKKQQPVNCESWEGFEDFWCWLLCKMTTTILNTTPLGSGRIQPDVQRRREWSAAQPYSRPHSETLVNEKVLVVVDATKPITKYALEWALTNVMVRPGESITFLALHPPGSHGTSMPWNLTRNQGYVDGVGR